MVFLTKRQKLLLGTIKELDEDNVNSKIFLEKVLFLLKKEENIDNYIKFYSFFPYRYGPFSYVSYSDLNKLGREGYIEQNKENINLTEKGKEVIKSFNLEDLKLVQKVKRIVSRFNSQEDILNYVYHTYPEYTIRSKLKIRKMSMKKKSKGILTIGYEGRDIDSFLDVLIHNEIEIVIDVRKNPFSMNFSFTKKKLEQYLKSVNIRYIHMPDLGVESSLRKNLRTMEDYRELLKKYKETTLKEQKEKVEEIIKLGEKHRIVLMCFEHDKNMCHRSIIADEIENAAGIKVMHL